MMDHEFIGFSQLKSSIISLGSYPKLWTSSKFSEDMKLTMVNIVNDFGWVKHFLNINKELRITLPLSWVFQEDMDLKKILDTMYIVVQLLFLENYDTDKII